jgi:hypothetical protein
LESAGNSRVGISPDEERTIVFWRRYAIIGTGVLVTLIVGVLARAAWFLWG